MDVYGIFLRTLRRIGPPTAKQRVLVAVSGGSDSVALLHLLLKLRESGPAFDLAVAHLDHGVRGEAGRKDAAFVADLATRHGLPLLAGRLDTSPSGIQTDMKEDVPHQDVPHRTLSDHGRDTTSLPSEDHLRRARLAFLGEQAAAWRGDRIALGHTRDDQAETTILNLLRGSGSRGLGGMRLTRRLGEAMDASSSGAGPPRTTGRSGLPPLIIRPVLEIPRADLRRWLSAQDISWREDSTNQNPRYLRNRVRAELMPLLEDLRAGSRDTLARAAGLLQDDNDLLESLARRELSGLDSVNLNARHLASLPRALARRVVRIAASQGTSGPTGALLRSGTAADASPLDRPPLLARTGSAGADRTNRDSAAHGAVWAPGSRQVEAVLDLAAAGKGGQVDLGRGHVARLRKGTLTFAGPQHEDPAQKGADREPLTPEQPAGKDPREGRKKSNKSP